MDTPGRKEGGSCATKICVPNQTGDSTCHQSALGYTTITIQMCSWKQTAANENIDDGVMARWGNKY